MAMNCPMFKTKSIAGFAALLMITCQPGFGELTTIQLSAPELDKGMPLMQALKNRKTIRNVSDKKLSPQHLSELLWAADGINRERKVAADGSVQERGGRTAPSAMGRYPVDIYVVLEEGVYLYKPAEHQLTPVAEGDFRKQTGRQEFVYSAPVNLVFVADLAKFTDGPRSAPREEKLKWAYLEAGHQAQNVYLYCASEGLGTTIRAWISPDEFGKVIDLRPDQTVIVAQTVGYPR